jgi:hypothetical protein
MPEFNEAGGGEAGCARPPGRLASTSPISCGIVNRNGRVGDIHELGSRCWQQHIKASGVQRLTYCAVRR